MPYVLDEAGKSEEVKKKKDVGCLECTDDEEEEEVQSSKGGKKVAKSEKAAPSTPKTNPKEEKREVSTPMKCVDRSRGTRLSGLPSKKIFSFPYY